MQLDFAPYRDKQKQIALSDEATERLRLALKEECTRQRKNASGQHAAKESRWTLAHKRPLATACAVAACLAFSIGIGLSTISASPASLATLNEAVADAPTLPFYRIQFDFRNEATLALPEKIIVCDPISLSLPYLDTESYTLQILNSDGVRFSVEENYESEPPETSSFKVSDAKANRVNLYAYYTVPMSEEEKTNLHTVPRNWTWNPRWAIELIERLRSCTIVVTTQEGKSYTYGINLDNYPTQEAIAERIHAREGYTLVYFVLDRKS